MLYAYTSGTGNNGSAFAGISANTPWYNTTIGIAMLIGRFMIIVPMLALAGNLGRKKQVPPSLGTFPVTTPLFTTLLVGVIVIVGVLTFFPVLSLGPIVEHFLHARGHHVLRSEEHDYVAKTQKLSIWDPDAGRAGLDRRACASSIRA